VQRFAIIERSERSRGWRDRELQRLGIAGLQLERRERFRLAIDNFGQQWDRQWNCQLLGRAKHDHRCSDREDHSRKPDVHG
jgi:hypothetical protein